MEILNKIIEQCSSLKESTEYSVMTPDEVMSKLSIGGILDYHMKKMNSTLDGTTILELKDDLGNKMWITFEGNEYRINLFNPSMDRTFNGTGIFDESLPKEVQYNQLIDDIKLGVRKGTDE